MLADFASCFALGALLLADPLAQPLKERMPLLIGYSVTACGFIFFFAPVTIGELYKYSRSNGSYLATFATGLVSFALAYVLLGAVLVAFGVDIYCSNYTLFFKTECQHGGRCTYGNCDCTLTGYTGGLCDVDDRCKLVNTSNACCTGPTCGPHWTCCAKDGRGCAFDTGCSCAGQYNYSDGTCMSSSPARTVQTDPDSKATKLLGWALVAAACVCVCVGCVGDGCRRYRRN